MVCLIEPVAAPMQAGSKAVAQGVVIQGWIPVVQVQGCDGEACWAMMQPQDWQAQQPAQMFQPVQLDPSEVRQQVEFYLSNDNLRHDAYLSEKISADPEGWLDIDLVLKCPAMTAAGATREDVVNSLQQSSVEVRGDGAAVRRPGNAPLPGPQSCPYGASWDWAHTMGMQGGQSDPAHPEGESPAASSGAPRPAESRRRRRGGRSRQAAQAPTRPQDLEDLEPAEGRRRGGQLLSMLQEPKQAAAAEADAGAKIMSLLHTEKDGRKAKSAADRCDQLAAQLRAGGYERSLAIEALRGSVRAYSFEDKKRCRLVQLALEVADKRDAAELVKELYGSVYEACRSPHANYVIQKVIEVLPATLSSFVIEELLGLGLEVAKHQYGCRIVCRLLEHSASLAKTKQLIDEVLSHTRALCRHNFGHHVVQSALEHGLPDQKVVIVAALKSDLLRNGQNRNASYVIEKAMTHCSAQHRQELAEELSSSRGAVVDLAQSRSGAYVLKTLVELPGPSSQRAMEFLRSAIDELRADKYGKKLFEELNLIEEGSC